ncbi:MAG: tetratricopeptide repeat protein [Bacteroidota bacterium]|nr:tetratricopeptide repeat protein [Bacteroidota bacterium]
MKYLISICIAILLTISIYAQNSDSIFYKIDQIESVETQIEKLIKHAEYSAGENNAFSEQCIKKAEILAQNQNDSCTLCIISFGKGILSQGKSEYQSAFTHYNNAYQCAKHCHNAYILIHSTNNLGVLNRYAKNYTKALEWYELSLRFSREYVDTLKILHTLNNIANIYNSRGEHTLAISYYQTCMKEIENYGNHNFYYGTIYPNLAYAYYANGDLNTAIEYYKKGFQIAQEKENNYHSLVILKTIGEIYLENEDPAKALMYLNKAEPYYQEIDHKKSESSFYMLRYKTYLSLGKHEAALKDLEKYQLLQDSMDLQNMHVLLSDIQEKYDNEKLKQINSKQNETIRKRNQMLFYIGLGGAFILALLVVSLQINRYRKKTNLALKQKQRIINEGLNYGRFVKEKLMLSSPNALIDRGLNHFIIDKPKEKVGGDFYLIREHQNGIYIILGDATGHGIPGGFISLTALNLFHRTLQHQENIRANELLSRVLNEWENMSNSKDAYDESFTAAVLFISNEQIETSHYRQKSILISDNKLSVIGKKTSLSSKIQNQKHTIKQGDWIILSSDGYYDQLGEKSQKTFRFKNFAALIESDITKLNSNIKERLLSKHKLHKGKQEQTDDICVIGIGF